LVLVVAVASFFIGAQRAVSRGERSASAEFSILRNSLLNLQRREDLYDPLLRKRLVALYNGSERLLAAQILDSAGMVVWKVPADSPYFALPNDPGAIGGFAAPKGNTSPYSSPLGGGMKLSALYFTLKRADIAAAAVLPIALSFSWAAISLFLLFNPFKKPRQRVEAKDEATGQASVESAESPVETPEDAPISVPASAPAQSAVLEAEAEEISLADAEIDAILDEEEVEEEIVEAPKPSFDESLSRLEKEIALWTAKRQDFAKESQDAKPEQALPDLVPPEPTTPPFAPPAAPPKEILDVASFPMPLSIQSPNLESKLSEELSRPLSDIALMLIHCSLASPGDPAAVALAVTIKDYIGSKDLVFELYKGGFAVALPSVDLGGALKMSEDLADVLATTLGLYKELEDSAPIYIGISAAAGRKVDSYKLFREASTAIHKAVSGGKSKILAFRPKA
ncbi:MAG: hypothetical protein FD137_2135, partial [Spirochaetes bacterium]